MTGVIESTAGGASAAEWLISVDDHVIEPPNVWLDRFPVEVQGDRAPGCVEDDNGEAWVYEDKRISTPGLVAAGRRRRRTSAPSRCPTRDMRPGCYDSVARLEDMDRRGILASLCFPSFPRLCGQIFYEAQGQGPRLCACAPTTTG